MASYSGNQFGDKRIYVFDGTLGTGGTQASFVTTIPFQSNMFGSTGAYFNAGGTVYGTTAELVPFIANKIYENYARSEQRTVTTFNNTPGQEGITSTIIKFTPDPRSHIAIHITGDQYGFTGEHMDEIHVTAADGNTYQGFLGRLAFGEQNPALGTTSGMLELLAYGLSGGSNVPSTAYDMTAGRTLMNKTNGVTGYVSTSTTLNIIDMESHKEAIRGQAAASVENNSITGATVGTRNGGLGQSVFWQQFDLPTINFVSTLLPAFAHGSSGVSASDATRGPGRYRVPEIFTLYAGVTQDLTQVDPNGNNLTWGANLNAITGGTLGGSEFEEFAHIVLHTHARGLNRKDLLNQQYRDLDNIREIDDISF